MTRGGIPALARAVEEGGRTGEVLLDALAAAVQPGPLGAGVLHAGVAALLERAQGLRGPVGQAVVPARAVPAEDIAEQGVPASAGPGEGAAARGRGRHGRALDAKDRPELGESVRRRPSMRAHERRWPWRQASAASFWNPGARRDK
ncbi:MAG TPA: hypothetical protein VH877_05300 [Polyangia bacterium]|jgi:hypothetical protein|nr:hypothetical protein [Polyangia bacterium]